MQRNTISALENIVITVIICVIGAAVLSGSILVLDHCGALGTKSEMRELTIAAACNEACGGQGAIFETDDGCLHCRCSGKE